MNKCLMVAALWGVLCPAFAEDKAKRVITILAPVSCVEWGEGRKTKTEVGPLNYKYASVSQEFWLLGVVTGINAGQDGPNLLESVDSSLIFEWMDRYCLENKSASVFNGATELLGKIKLKVRR